MKSQVRDVEVSDRSARKTRPDVSRSVAGDAGGVSSGRAAALPRDLQGVLGNARVAQLVAASSHESSAYAASDSDDGEVVQRTKGWATLGALAGAGALGLATGGLGWGALGLLGGGLLGHGVSEWYYSDRLRKPKTGQVTLEDLPRDQWWRLFIDRQHHEQALRELEEEGLDPAEFYDRDESPGFRKAMETAFEQQLLFGGWQLGRKLRGYEDYNALHDLLTESLPKNPLEPWRYGPSGSDVTQPGQPDQTIGDTRFNIGGKNRVAGDLREETLLGKPVIRPMTVENKGRPDSITRIDEETGTILTSYKRDEGKAYVNAALARYYREVGSARGREAKLRAIVKVIRALHVIHAFRDANGRLHIMLMLNKFLTEEGFSPVLLENDPEIFGGSYSVDELVDEVEEGMVNFRGLVSESKKEKSD